MQLLVDIETKMSMPWIIIHIESYCMDSNTPSCIQYACHTLQDSIDSEHSLLEHFSYVKPAAEFALFLVTFLS